MVLSSVRPSAKQAFQQWHRLKSTFCAASLLAATLAVAWPAQASDQFTKPSKEELEMTSLPGYPGAPAVVLYREMITKDNLHVFQHYERIKVLTEDGKKYANVELPYFSTSGDGFDPGDDKKIGDIVGRTIHADGTIVPFTGKPYLKTMEKAQGYKIQEMIFTLPDVQVGSIIEYRYATRYNDEVFEAPTWIIQGDLYVKSAHYTWYPTSENMTDPDAGGALVSTISWFPILPDGVKVNRTELPQSGTASNAPTQMFEVVIKDVPPNETEEFMPPIANLSYRVYFNFTAYRTAAEYWKSKGKHWSKEMNSFAGPNGSLSDATQKIVAGAATPEAKLQKIYAAVMALENTEFTRDRDRREDKAAGLGKVNNAGDVLEHKRGTPTQITLAFIGMARAAGFKAYAMLVPDRSNEIFMPAYLSMSQFDDVIAIVNVDGKDRFFDPGSRYCAYGHLAWEHTYLGSGLRQTEDGTDFGPTPGDPYTFNKTTRVANLTMDGQGQVSGKIDLTFYGSPALRWRHAALRGDEESLHHQLEKDLEGMVPKSLDVKVSNIQNLEDYDKPLIVSFETKGAMGTATGKRLVMPADLFLAGASATFPHEKRHLPVYFPYSQMVQDAERVNLPANMMTEAVPADAKLNIPNKAMYNMTVAQTPSSFTMHRNYLFGDFIVPVAEYPALRTFYSQFEGKDQESVVVKMTPASASAATPAAQ